jgi:hypothetical protein
MVDVARLAYELRTEQVGDTALLAELRAKCVQEVFSLLHPLLSDMVTGSFLLGKKIYLFPARHIAKPNCLSIPLNCVYTYTFH